MFNFDLTEILLEVFNWLVGRVLGFFTSLGRIFVDILTGILNVTSDIVPDPSSILTYYNQIFDLITPYLSYLKDMLFISSPVLIYLVSSIIFRILAKRNIYAVKLIVGWINKIRG